MSETNGVIRIGRKGRKKFAFGDDPPFEVDVVDVFHQWLAAEEDFRSQYEEDSNGVRQIPNCDSYKFNLLAVQFVESIQGIKTDDPNWKPTLSKAEAFDFLARLRESYDELVVFFRPKSLQKQDSQGTSEPQSEVVFSEEPATS